VKGQNSNTGPSRYRSHCTCPRPSAREATAIQAVLASKPVKILAVYLSPTQPLIASDLSACLGGGLPVLMAGDLNAKHVEWNSGLITKRQTCVTMLIRINASSVCRTLLPLYTPTYTTPDVPDIPIMTDVVSPVYLTTCSALSSVHIPVLIDTMSIFLSPPDRRDLRTTGWPNFQACLEAELPPNPDLPNGGAIDACRGTIKCYLESVGRFHSQSSPTCRPTAPLPAHIQDEIRLKNRLRRQLQITRDPALKAEVNRLQRSVTSQLNERRNDR